MTYSAEERWLLADALLDEGKIAEGKVLLEEILEEEPGYGRAHNHLGWIFAAKYSDYGRAERHFRLALQYAPEYPPPYLQMASLLFELRRWDELESHIRMALEVSGVDRAVLYDYLGNLYEIELQYYRAVGCYQNAIDASLNGYYIQELRKSIKRVMAKAPQGVRFQVAWRDFKVAVF